MSKHAENLIAVTRTLIAPGKGLLAADESFGSIEARFEAVDVVSTPETRRDYREMLLATPGIGQFLSGVILFDETIRQTTRDGRPFTELLIDQGILPGIKVDRGAHPLAGFPGEKITEGLDELRPRLIDYRARGAVFAKWRAVIQIETGLPSGTCLEANSETLARYAALCQEVGLVPIVEPEVLMEGAHDQARCGEVTLATLHGVFRRLVAHRVLLEGLLLKPNMVLPGASAAQVSPVEAADATLRCLRQAVQPAVPGIVFLSGGQSPEQATANLNEMNRRGPQPWELTFSFSRALQLPALEVWSGRPENVPAAQRIFYERCRLASAARMGTYTPAMEAAVTGDAELEAIPSPT